ncbi:DUF6624 domain-containing protein [Streptomyces virginiae]|uniref:DUF6624 domain-containing protein n=1 Tax=Streptomyces virginiae TaxID=1961 RepID=UPI0036ACA768
MTTLFSTMPSAVAPAPAADQAVQDSSPSLPEMLIAWSARDEALTARSARLPGVAYWLREVAAARTEHERALVRVVNQHGWPSVDLVGDEAATAALRILLHGQDHAFLLRCRDLIAAAVGDGACSQVHLAYVVDWCLVRLAQPQLYATAINPALGRPYPVADPDGLDTRRNEMCLPPLAQELARHQTRRLAS